jgi:hypothetical protein
MNDSDMQRRALEVAFSTLAGVDEDTDYAAMVGKTIEAFAAIQEACGDEVYDECLAIVATAFHARLEGLATVADIPAMTNGGAALEAFAVAATIVHLEGSKRVLADALGELFYASEGKAALRLWREVRAAAAERERKRSAA